LSNIDARRVGPIKQLVGRDRELELIRSFLDDASSRGGALLLSGEAGVGKTALLEATVEVASAIGARVLRAVGAEFETDVSFSGLSQLLLPLFAELDRLSDVHRSALSAALGLGDGPPPDRLLVSIAALELLHRAAADRLLLLVVDDLHWFDRSSAIVLGLVARRLTGSRIGFIAAFRSGAETFFDRAGLPGYDVQPLGRQASAQLLDDHFPGLAPRVRQRVLTAADGNALALLEFPGAMSDPRRGAARALTAIVPLDRRIQALFASHVGNLPAGTRQLLLLAALEGSGDLGILSAASGEEELDDLVHAERTQLIQVDQGTHGLRFRHPLIPAAVVELSTSGERRRAHHALALALADQPEREAWHLAEATVGPDEQVADLLEQAAHRVLGRGDAMGAVANLLRAADLSPRGQDRSRRLAKAAYVGADVAGELRDVSRLLADARVADPERGGSLQAAVAAAFLLINAEGDVGTAHRLLVGALENWGSRYDSSDAVAVEAVYTLLSVCFFGTRPELWAPFHAALARFVPRAPAILALCATLFADPARASLAQIDELETVISRLHAESDPAVIVRVGRASFFVDRMAGCRDANWRVVREGRDGGAITSAIYALINLCLDDYLIGDWDAARQLSNEGVHLCETHGYRLLAWPFWFGEAIVAAARGEDETMRTLTEMMDIWSAPRQAEMVHLYACHARGLAALGRGDFEYAYHQLSCVSPPGVLASHVPLALWTAMDFVEAAVRTGRRAEAVAHVTAMREADIAALSPRLALVSLGSAAIAAADDHTTELFEDALAIPGAGRWAFDLARVNLAYGEHLRRARVITRARIYLTEALDGFERLRATPWATRAAYELRATGHPVRTDDPNRAALTPQEREIVALAATGLTNKQIGQRLHLSHRTIGAHLYQAFPKLGVTSRAALRDALAAAGEPDEQRRQLEARELCRLTPACAGRFRYARPCGCRLFIRAGQAACRYSWRVPPSRSRLRTSRCAIRSGSVIGAGSGRSGAAARRVRWGLCSL
jgi:DNA-binding CsgD family transcriptional regulator